ncbi:MAG: hypothetical protein GWO02_22050 [Gammaproteobacteria bacterium]|nr:hypothetical protein [Gammaproteobacteria bacterium]
MSSEQQQQPDLSMDPKALYREEVFTDRRAGTITRLTPVQGDGTDDPSRSVVYVGQTQLMTPVGTLPISFELPAASLDEAARQFAEAARQAAERTMEELKELRREQASRIVTPEGGQGVGGGQGGFPGGGGGGIRMP